MKAKACILDVDGTVSPEVSWLALTRDLGASVERHREIFEDYRLGRTQYPHAKRQLINLWRSTGHATRDEMKVHFEQWPLEPAALPLVQGLTGAGIIVCLITGSVDLYAQIMARRLGVKYFFANTTLVFNHSGELVDFHYELDQGLRKLEQLEEFVRDQGILLQDCVVVGDSDSELDLFYATKHGILLRRPEQSPELVQAAWRVAERLEEVASLISHH